MSYFKICGIAAFVCFISACQISSYFADKHDINWLFWIITIASGLVAAFYAYKGFSNNDGSKDEVV